ncbi:SPOR domain-containing protein [Ramlibacter rhizophilus]|uniref:Sporulation protein n=1 Tax=Ramlibacter rhizophilus TaxID=1781167 RepID=A0A4Z0BIM5_9BURK|nr:SPOR domain-containing protein [Ramlibacter rhizophilus]TFY98107.1 sporulation protein [Ramlibacter rhizophilus]
MNKQQGGTFLGLIIGVVLGLGAALAVAVYVTKVPVPFMNKHQARTPEQDAAESRKNQNWDPNAPLYGKNPARPQAAATPAAPVTPAPPSAAVATPVERAVVAPAGAQPPAVVANAPATARPGGDPLGDLAARAGGTDPFLYFVQAGAFRTAEDAEAQRAKLSLMGLEARVTEREQSGRPVFRVRVGPFDRKEDADRNRSRLEAGGFEAALVRVQR